MKQQNISNLLCSSVQFVAISLTKFTVNQNGCQSSYQCSPQECLGIKGCSPLQSLRYDLLFCIVLPSRHTHYDRTPLNSNFPYCHNIANPSAIIRKYHLDMCRQCFRERALDIGFVKVRLFSQAVFLLLFELIYDSSLDNTVLILFSFSFQHLVQLSTASKQCMIVDCRFSRIFL